MTRRSRDCNNRGGTDLAGHGRVKDKGKNSRRRRGIAVFELVNKGCKRKRPGQPLGDEQDKRAVLGGKAADNDATATARLSNELIESRVERSGSMVHSSVRRGSSWAAAALCRSHCLSLSCQSLPCFR